LLILDIGCLTVRSEIISLRSERDKLDLEANFAKERLDRFMKEFENQVTILFGFVVLLSLSLSSPPSPSPKKNPICYLSDLV
jgi:hypothetical protein